MNGNNIPDEKLMLFRTVVNLLNKTGIKYWLDQGSLLGAVRDGSLLPWDHDVDIAVNFDDFKRCRKTFTKELRSSGVNVDVYPYMLITHYNYNGEKNIPVHLKFYFASNGFTYAEFHTIENLNTYEEIYKKVIMRGLKYSRLTGFYCANKVNDNKMYGLFFRALYALNIGVSVFLVKCREPLKDRLVVFRTDKKYFEKLDEIKIHEVNIKIPANSEKYLKYKYGLNWKIPTQDWVWWRDDGALYKVEYRKKGLISPKFR